MTLLRNAFWISLFVIFTFLFVVFFEYGTTNFVKNAKQEYKDARVFFGIDQPKDEKKEAAPLPQ